MTVLDAAPVRRALGSSADPLTGRAALARLVEAHPALTDELATSTQLASALVAVSVASHSLFAVLERDEGAIAMLGDSRLRAPVTLEACQAEVGALLAHDDPQAALRRWKHRQIVHIAGRDLLGVADLRTVGAELA